tara:strand:- start:75 stop:1073 length:999 start_codon:yes stop_codon:yes gene_type:complete
MRIGIVGAGKFGLALAKIAAEKENQVLIYSRRVEEVNSINDDGKSLSGVEFPSNKKTSATSFSKDLINYDVLLIAVPSKDFRSIVGSLDINIKTIKIVSCAKGFEEKSGKLMSEILENDFGVPENNIFVLSGPNLSKEISDKELTGTVIAGKDKDFIDQLSKSISNDYFIPFSNTDRYGVEMGGAMKNIYAIISGYFHEKGVGENTIGLLLTKSLEEISLYSNARGANASTFLGLSGVGDFFSTALSEHSRNYQFGKLLAMDKSPAEALEIVNDTVEGYLTSRIVYSDTKKRGLDLKILNFLMELYKEPKSLDEAKKIFQASSIEEDIKSIF